MIKRLYIHNFRCFENFEFLPDGRSPAAVIGKNGVGKSSLADVLRIFRRIGAGENAVPSLLRKEDVPGGAAGRIVRFELSAEIGGRVYDYRTAFERPGDSAGFRVSGESLSVGGADVFTRDAAQVELAGAGGAPARFPVDRQLLALPIIQDAAADSPVALLREWMGRMLILKPWPDRMRSDAEEGRGVLEGPCENFAGWLSSLLADYPEAYGRILGSLRAAQPDFAGFFFERLGADARRLWVRYGACGKERKMPFGALSDGEKCFFLSAAVRSAALVSESLFCFWDEPDNFLSLREVGFFIPALCRDFSGRGQLLFTTHSGEAILALTDEETWMLSRNSHLEPTLPPATLAAMRRDKTLVGDLRAALLSGEVEA